MPPSCDTVPEADAADTKMADPKIIDLIKAREGEGQGPFTSLEFFPPRTDEGVKVSLHCGAICLFLLVLKVLSLEGIYFGNAFEKNVEYLTFFLSSLCIALAFMLSLALLHLLNCACVNIYFLCCNAMQ